MKLLLKMNYPVRLLPQSNYKKIDWSKDLSPLFLLRYTKTQDILDETKKLRIECIATQADHLRDLSTNLLGYFLIEDHKIEIIQNEKFFFCEWNEGEYVREPICNVDFVVNEDRGCFYFNIEEIVSSTFLHIDHTDNNKNYQLTFKILHTPVVCNFWHFSIRVFYENQLEISTLDVRPNLKKAIWRKAKEQLRECAIINAPEFGKLKSKHYLCPRNLKSS